MDKIKKKSFDAGVKLSAKPVGSGGDGMENEMKIAKERYKKYR